jgi:hypothetical protein
MDLRKINGPAQLRAEKRFMANGGIPGSGRASDEYCCYLISEASGLPYEAITMLIGPDFTGVILVMQNFLLDTGWA